MTSQEARKQIETCERQITDAYSRLRSDARHVGTRGYQAASNASQRTFDGEAREEKVFGFIVLTLVLSIFFCAAMPGEAFCWIIIAICVFGVLFHWLSEIRSEEEMREKWRREELKKIDSQRANLNTILDNNRGI